MNNNSNFADDFIGPYEAESLVEQINDIDLKEYGSKQWFKQHEILDRLNIQAHKNALGSTDEFVMEAFVTHDKIRNLVTDLITSETWKDKVFPLIFEDVAKLSTIKSYICVYHEASICNLLEVILFHRTAVESDEDAVVELIDYCYRKLVNITARASEIQRLQEEIPKAKDPKDYLNRTAAEELKDQTKEIEFSCTMASLSIIRFITDHIRELSVPVVHQLMENNDIPCVLVPILELKPWIRKTCKGETEKWEDQKWIIVPKEQSGKIAKIEIQIWLSIYNLFLSQEVNRRYEVTSYRKQNLLRLRKYLNEQLLDQLPMLSNMLRALEEMSMMGDNPIAQKNSFIVQQMPEIREKIIRGRDWKAIAKYQMDNFFNKDANNPQEEMESLLKLYGSDIYDQFMDDPKCAGCGDIAKQRCSKCKNEWYCSRECQLKMWKQHKTYCALQCEVIQKVSQNESKTDNNQETKVQQINTIKKPLIQELN